MGERLAEKQVDALVGEQTRHAPVVVAPALPGAEVGAVTLLDGREGPCDAVSLEDALTREPHGRPREALPAIAEDARLGAEGVRGVDAGAGRGVFAVNRRHDVGVGLEGRRAPRRNGRRHAPPEQLRPHRAVEDGHLHAAKVTGRRPGAKQGLDPRRRRLVSLPLERAGGYTGLR